MYMCGPALELSIAALPTAHTWPANVQAQLKQIVPTCTPGRFSENSKPFIIATEL